VRNPELDDTDESEEIERILGDARAGEPRRLLDPTPAIGEVVLKAKTLLVLNVMGDKLARGAAISGVRGSGAGGVVAVVRGTPRAPRP
jgi:hypothetical protein